MRLEIERDNNYIEVNGFIGYINDKDLICLDREDMNDDEYNEENYREKLGEGHLFIYLKDNLEVCEVEAYDKYVSIYFNYEDLLKIN